MIGRLRDLAYAKSPRTVRCEYCGALVAELSRHYAAHPRDGGCPAVAMAFTDWWPYADELAEKNARNGQRNTARRGQTAHATAAAAHAYRARGSAADANLCARCGKEPRVPKWNYCRACGRAKTREYYQRRKAERR